MAQAFVSAAPPQRDIPRDSYDRYLIPRFPLDRPLTEADGPVPPTSPQQVPWTRVSTIAKAVQDKYGIGLWQMRLTVKGLALRPDLYALAAACLLPLVALLVGRRRP